MKSGVRILQKLTPEWTTAIRDTEYRDHPEAAGEISVTIKSALDLFGDVMQGLMTKPETQFLGYGVRYNAFHPM